MHSKIPEIFNQTFINILGLLIYIHLTKKKVIVIALAGYRLLFLGHPCFAIGQRFSIKAVMKQPQVGNKVLSNIVASQADINKKFGGVVPEIASRHQGA